MMFISTKCVNKSFVIKNQINEKRTLINRKINKNNKKSSKKRTTITNVHFLNKTRN